MTTHVAIVRRFIATALRDGRKRIESRLSRTRRPPFGRVAAGDLLYFKQSGSGVFGYARVRAVRRLERLTPAGVRALQRRHESSICGGVTYWRRHRAARYATLIWLDRFHASDAGPRIARQFGNAWVVLGANLGTAGVRAARNPRSVIPASA